jgi:hypothetical protein
MDQDLGLDEVDAADTLHKRVRIASSAPKAPQRPPHPLPADADVDMLSLVRPPSPLYSTTLSLLTPFCSAPLTYGRAARLGVRTTHETMGQ